MAEKNGNLPSVEVPKAGGSNLPRPGGVLGLSPEKLQQHDNSLSFLAEQGVEKQDRVASWIDALNQPLPEENSSEEEPESSGPTAPGLERQGSYVPSLVVENIDNTDHTAAPLVMVAGDRLGKSESSAKMARVQGMMNTDSKGNLFKPVVMSTQGRYVTSSNNAAFKKINFNELNTIHDQGNVQSPGSKASVVSRTKLLSAAQQIKQNSLLTKKYSGLAALSVLNDSKPAEADDKKDEDTVPALQTEEDTDDGPDSMPKPRGRRDSVTVRAFNFLKDTFQSPRLSVEEEEERSAEERSAEERSLAVFKSALQSALQSPNLEDAESLPASSIADVTESKPAPTSTPGPSKPKALLSIGAIANLRRWRTKSKKASTLTKKEFAENEAHLKLLNQASLSVATEVPLPLKVVLFEEAHSVIIKTAKAYEKSFGKTHPLTMEANKQLEEMNATAHYMAQL